MKVAFVTNYEKTIFFHGVATRLEAQGHEVSWIAPSGHWARWLLARGVARSAVLDLSHGGAAWDGIDATDTDRDELAALEQGSGLFINDVILMDRILRVRPHGNVVRYLAVMRRALDVFLAERDIAIVFAEQTFAVELLAGMVCRRAGRSQLVPDLIRIPDRRMGFFRGHVQAELVPLRPVDDDARSVATTFLAEFRRERPRPVYFHRWDRMPTPDASWPRKLWKHVQLAREDRYDETHFSPGWLVKKRSTEVVNAMLHKLSDRYWTPPETPPRPFVLFPLHRQPEASIDVLGSRLSNQRELVRALARTLPVTHDLYVKEHPNGLGDRTPAFMRELAEIPSVRLVEPSVRTADLVARAALTVVVSGTPAYEAGLFGHRAVTAVPMFFSPLLEQTRFDPYVDSLAALLAKSSSRTDDDRIEFLAQMYASSYPGVIDNPNFFPEVLDPRNLDGVAAGFAELLGGQAWRPQQS